MASTRRKCCCCACWIQLVSTFDCDDYAWTTPTIAVKQTATPTDPLNRWYTAGDTGEGCAASFWKCIGTTAECDTLSVDDEYTGAGTPSDIDATDCCDEDPDDPGPPPADGTPCATDSNTYATVTGFSIDHTCTAVFSCDTSTDPDTNGPGGTARILNGSSFDKYAGFMHPNGNYLVDGFGSIDWPRVTPGTGGTPSENLRRASVTWSEGDANSCNEDGFGSFGNVLAPFTVEVDCSGATTDQVRVRIDFPFKTNECTGAAYAFDSGWVTGPKSNGFRRSITVGDSAGSGRVHLTNGSVTVSYCCG